MKTSTIEKVRQAVNEVVKIEDNFVEDTSVYYPEVSNADEVIKAIKKILDDDDVNYQLNDRNTSINIYSGSGANELAKAANVSLNDIMHDWFNSYEFIEVISRPRIKRTSNKITKRVIYDKARALVKNGEPVGTQTLVPDYNGVPATMQEFGGCYLITLTKKNGRKEITTWEK
ncbi:hypothetical protein [Leuconostoc falkenbergense]|uniref:hypothetical protein n=1 Tax=Leuconostoc falkenbergense TaxID=2766470 RepID=UPI00293D0B73|nr:hypothetical protein [Leuconostoc falkenbergense]MDV3544869.1 hypothetical protein [Leuconostoc falkenbergense]